MKTAKDALKKRSKKTDDLNDSCSSDVRVVETGSDDSPDYGKLVATIGSVDEAKSKITVALYRIGDGPVRVGIERTFVTSKGVTKHGKLGRLNLETAAKLGPLLIEAGKHAKGV